jgi:hypothetical protein
MIFIVDAKDQTRLLLWIKDALPKADYDRHVIKSKPVPPGVAQPLRAA